MKAPTYNCTSGMQAVQLAEAQALPVTFNRAGQPMVDGMRADFWLRLRNKETVAFNGSRITKEA